MAHSAEPPHVLLTGASRGLGAAIAAHLSGSGQLVTMVMRSPPREGAQLPANTRCLIGDLARLDRLEQLVDAAEAIGPVDVLINCAGIADDGLIVLQDVEALEHMTRVNFLAPMILMRQAGRHMMRRRAGRVINISSISARRALRGLTAYGASKAGLEQLTIGFAAEMAGRGIAANAIAPGYVPTDMSNGLSAGQRDAILRRTPSGATTTSADVCAVVDFLMAAPLNVTGQVFAVDGGFSL